MKDGETSWAIVPQEKNTLVVQVKTLYKVHNDLWEVVDLGRVLIFSDAIKKPQYRVKESQLFRTETEAIIAAQKIAPKHNKGGHN